MHPPPESLQLVDQRTQPLRGTGDEGDVGTLAGEPSGDRQPEPGSRGDHGDDLGHR
jgi:hypothetical protein